MVILGLDPGTATTGYGVLCKTGLAVKVVEFGVIRTPAGDPAPERLAQIFARLEHVFDMHVPDVLVTERLFFARNETTAFAVGRCVGVAMLLAAQRGIPWMEYTPPQVKQTVVGYGSADKRQVQYMVQRILGLPSPPTPDDAADALAVAICHAHSCPPCE